MNVKNETRIMKKRELDFALQNLENNSSPGLDGATLVRPDAVGHLVRLDRPAAVGLDVVVPVLLLLAAPASLGRLPAPRPQGPAPLARL